MDIKTQENNLSNSKLVFMSHYKRKECPEFADTKMGTIINDIVFDSKKSNTEQTILAANDKNNTCIEGVGCKVDYNKLKK